MLTKTNKEEEGFMTDDQMEDQCHGLLFNAFHADGSGGPQCWKDLPEIQFHSFPVDHPDAVQNYFDIMSWVFPAGTRVFSPYKWTGNE